MLITETNTMEIKRVSHSGLQENCLERLNDPEY